MSADHWAFLSSHDGKRLKDKLFDVCVPSGWVVDSRLPNKAKETIKAYVIPLKVGGWDLLGRIRAMKYLRNIKAKYGSNIIMLMVPCEDTENGWFISPVLVEDLRKSAPQLLQEATEAIREGQELLRDMKECALLAVTNHDLR